MSDQLVTWLSIFVDKLLENLDGKLVKSDAMLKLKCYLAEDVWLFVADLIRPKRTGDFPHPNTRRNLSLNLNEKGCSLLSYAQSIMLTYLEDIVL